MERWLGTDIDRSGWTARTDTDTYYEHIDIESFYRLKKEMIVKIDVSLFGSVLC